MILQALSHYYERLQNDPQEDVAPFGFSRQKISFCIVLNDDGSLAQINDLRESADGRSLPRSIAVPHPGGKRSVNIKPYFLWDKISYVLGRDLNDEQKDSSKRARFTKQFEAFRDLHLEWETTIASPAYAAVCRFLKSWNPDNIDTLGEILGETSGSNFVFSMRGKTGYVHDIPEVRTTWLRSLSADGSTAIGRCLVTGETGAVCLTHSAIKGIRDPGGQAEKSIVSFNRNAFESYGKKQGANSPVSQQAAFQYTTALNKLLADKNRTVQIGDATTVFWTEKPTVAEQAVASIFGSFNFASDEAEDADQVAHVKTFLDRLRQGKPDELAGRLEDRSVPFYILGLSPSNVARISVRYWLESTVGQLAKNLAIHVQDLSLLKWEHVRAENRTNFERVVFDDGPIPSVYDMLDETVITKKGWPDRDKIRPNLVGAMLESILQNRPLPHSLWQAVLSRVITDGLVDRDKRQNWREARHNRMAILKACLCKHSRHHSTTKEAETVDVYLNRLHPNPAYHCGRLMGVLSFVQEVALKKVNASVVRRHLSAVSRMPAFYLGRLQTAAEVGHLPKLPGKLPEKMRDEIKQISAQLKDGPDRELDYVGQTLFMLGFYQELADLEAKRASHEHVHRTMMGEWVRSIGELRLANSMTKLGIPYCYEPCAILEKGKERFPDFFVPGVEVSEGVYIEYLGVQDSADYDNRWNIKEAAYFAAGITPEGGPRGRLLIIDNRTQVDTPDETAFSQILKNFNLVK